MLWASLGARKQSGLNGLKPLYYLKLNKKETLWLPISPGFMVLKLALRVDLLTQKMEEISLHGSLLFS